MKMESREDEASKKGNIILLIQFYEDLSRPSKREYQDCCTSVKMKQFNISKPVQTSDNVKDDMNKCSNFQSQSSIFIANYNSEKGLDITNRHERLNISKFPNENPFSDSLEHECHAFRPGGTKPIENEYDYMIELEIDPPDVKSSPTQLKRFREALAEKMEEPDMVKEKSSLTSDDHPRNTMSWFTCNTKQKNHCKRKRMALGMYRNSGSPSISKQNRDKCRGVLISLFHYHFFFHHFF